MASSDGRVLYVAGTLDASDGARYGLVAYKTRQGGELWASPFDGPDGVPGVAYSIALSPDGSLVFVTGATKGPGNADYGTAAYDAATGARVWVAAYDGPAHGSDVAYSIAASPDGSKVFVTGASWAAENGPDYATVVYNAASGQQLWVQRYEGADHYYDEAESVVVSPDGALVFVTGRSSEGTTNVDYTTIAYDSATGEQRWLSHYNGPGNVNDAASAAAVSPDGKTLFVTGYSWWSDSTWENTVAYNAATGAQLWARRRSSAFGAAITVSPDGSTVLVAGTFYVHARSVFGTLAYSATGHRLWKAVYSGGKDDGAAALAVSPDGSRVYVTGWSEGSLTGTDYATVSYLSSTGAEVWHARYEGPTTRSYDAASVVVVSPDSATAYVSGVSRLAFRTIAYAS